MKTQYYTASSLDGFIADDQHSLEWLFQFSETPIGEYEQFLSNVGALAMGSSTYEWLLRNHISPVNGKSQPWPYSQPTWVFTTRSLPSVGSADIRFVRGDVLPIHAEMTEAAQGKNVWIVGGGELVGQFHDHGLLDEIIVQITSVTLGRGAPLLPRRITSPPLELSSVEQFGKSFAQLTYRVVRA